jgi:hypothetical protein
MDVYIFKNIPLQLQAYPSPLVGDDILDYSPTIHWVNKTVAYG